LIGRRRIAKFLFIGLILITICFLLGPRPKVHLKLEEIDLPPIQELANYFNGQESKITGLMPGTEKHIRFYRDEPKVTEFAVVFVHGFSASRQECSPVQENVANHLKANLFCTRLTAHGLDGEKFGEVTANDWLNDINEAVAVGKQLGRRVVLIGMSTGGTLSLWRANRVDDVEVLILLSPNFGVANPNANLALLPWGRQLIRIIQGSHNEFVPKNERHARYWTEKYRSEGIVEMLALVNYCCRQDYSEFEIPCLCVYSEKDELLDLSKIQNQFNSLVSSSRKKIVALSNSPGHRLTGEILAPETVTPLTLLIIEFLDGILPGNLSEATQKN